MRRREFIKLIGGTAAAWSTFASAQQNIPVLAYFGMVQTRKRKQFILERYVKVLVILATSKARTLF